MYFISDRPSVLVKSYLTILFLFKTHNTSINKGFKNETN